MTAPYNYSSGYVSERAGSGGKDPGRKAYADALFARARAGDQAALQELGWRSGVAADPNPSDKEGSWATADARNYGQSLLGQLGGGFTPRYEQANDGSFNVGRTLGGALKVAAPFAGLIPGVGPLVGAGLAAGGSALGGALHGDRFNLLDTALAGGAGYLGGKFNPFGSRAGPLGASGLGNATQSGAGIGGQGLSQVGNAGIGALPEGAYQSFPGLPGGITDAGMSGGPMGGGGGGGFLDNIFGGGGGGGFLDKVLQYGPGIVGGIGAANRQHESDQMMQDAVRGAQAEWAARAPLRAFSQEQILGLPGIQRPDLASVFADPGNPFYRPG